MIILGPVIKNNDEWDTGLTHSDPEHYFNRDEFLHTGIFRNQNILERRKRIDRRINRIISDRTSTRRYPFKNKKIIKRLMIFLIIYFILELCFVMGIYLNDKTKPKKIDSPTIVEKFQLEENDRYGSSDKY